MSAIESIATPVRPTSPTRARVVGVVAELRRQVERDRQPRLTVVEQVAVARIRLLGRGEAGVLPDRPRAAAVHVGVRPARVRIGARSLERRRRIVRRVERFHFDTRLGFAPVEGGHGESMLARVRVLACVLLARVVLVVRRGGTACELPGRERDDRLRCAETTFTRSRSPTAPTARVGKAPTAQPRSPGIADDRRAREDAAHLGATVGSSSRTPRTGRSCSASSPTDGKLAVLRDRLVRVRARSPPTGSTCSSSPPRAGRSHHLGADARLPRLPHLVRRPARLRRRAATGSRSTPSGCWSQRRRTGSRSRCGTTRPRSFASPACDARRHAASRCSRSRERRRATSSPPAGSSGSVALDGDAQPARHAARRLGRRVADAGRRTAARSPSCASDKARSAR